MPNRSMRVTAAGARDLMLALALAFGDQQIVGYRCDHHGAAGDALWLFTEDGDKALALLAMGASLGCRFPVPMDIASVAAFALQFIERCKYPKGQDFDGHSEGGGFHLQHRGDVVPWHDRLVCITPAWREFHK